MFNLLRLAVFLFLIFCLTKSFVLAHQLDSTPVVYRVVNNNAFGGGGGYISVLNALTLEEIRQVPFKVPAARIEVTPSQDRAFVTHRRNFSGQGLTVLDLQRGTNLGELFVTTMVNNFKVSSDNILWVLLADSRIILLNPNTLQIITELSTSDNPQDIIFSPDGNRAYVSLENSNIVVFDVKARRAIRVISNLPPGSAGFVRAMEMSLSSDGSILCLASKETISVIDTSSFVVTNTINFSNESTFKLTSILFSPDNNFLYIAELNGFNLYVCNFRTTQITKIFTPPFNSAIQDIKLSLDGRLLYISERFSLDIYDTQTNTIIKAFQDSQTTLSSGIYIAGNFNRRRCK